MDITAPKTITGRVGVPNDFNKTGRPTPMNKAKKTQIMGKMPEIREINKSVTQRERKRCQAEIKRFSTEGKVAG